MQASFTSHYAGPDDLHWTCALTDDGIDFIGEGCTKAEALQDAKDRLIMWRFQSMIQIDIEKLLPGPPRPHDNLSKLAASIAIDGLHEPLKVEALPDGLYQIVSGSRRFRAIMVLYEADAPVLLANRVGLARTVFKWIPCEVLQ